jgi:hypothetical protein
MDQVSRIDSLTLQASETSGGRETARSHFSFPKRQPVSPTSKAPSLTSALGPEPPAPHASLSNVPTVSKSRVARQASGATRALILTAPAQTRFRSIRTRMSCQVADLTKTRWVRMPTSGSSTKMLREKKMVMTRSQKSRTLTLTLTRT